jgi:hypothetical protein
MSAPSAPIAPIAYEFAVLRAVPHVYIGAFTNVAVVLHARTAEFVAMRALTDPAELARRVPDADTQLLAEYLRSLRAVAAGEDAAGEVALSPPSERFHWLTSPRSDVLQSSPVHEGVCDDPASALDELFARYVG